MKNEVTSSDMLRQNISLILLICKLKSSKPLHFLHLYSNFIFRSACLKTSSVIL
uniref:Uncharacterized protein n=1 Tax=Octopus bimaculoides TaxID=37653 RepID=A0A0L8HWW9_OCTBM